MFNEMMMKSLLKAIDLEKLASLPQVRELIDIATNIRDDFRTIKDGQREILARLDALEAKGHDEGAILPFPLRKNGDAS